MALSNPGASAKTSYRCVASLLLLAGSAGVKLFPSFVQDPEYKNYVLAHVKDLKYLDYRTVEAAAVSHLLPVSAPFDFPGGTITPTLFTGTE